MRPEAPSKGISPRPWPKKPGAPVSSVWMWACLWQSTDSNGRHRAAQAMALDAVPDATKRTSASASSRARTTSAASRVTWSVP